MAWGVQTALAALPVQPAAALRRSWAEGYGAPQLKADAMAGAVVGIVALPLSMALAIASGVAPQHGLYTAIVSGFLIALLGGSRVQVSGPTAAFVVILAPIATRHGLGGLLVATVLAGLMLMAMGLARFGKLIEFVPYPVTTGFTAGIAVVIATLQVRDFLGLDVAKMPEHFPERVAALFHALPTAHLSDVVIGGLTLAILLLWPQAFRQVPAPLVALPLAIVAAALIQKLIPGMHAATIADRFAYDAGGGLMAPGIPRLPPLPGLPWNFPGGDGAPLGLDFALIRDLAPSAFAIAMLGAIESLLSAVVADGMTGHKHDPDAELFAQGVGNLVGPFLGGFAATGAIARTATNIRSGAKTPVAAMIHALIVLAAVVLLAPLLGMLPMAALAALLFVVAWNMSEAKHFGHTLRAAPRADVIVLLLCFGLTVVFDMVVSVTVGVLLASLLFMKRMAEVSGVRLVEPDEHPRGEPLPRGVLLYEVAGPLFFGAAQKAMSALETVNPGVRVVLLDLRAVPAMDATAMVNLESAFERLHRHEVLIVLGGVQPQPLRAMARAGWSGRKGRLLIYRSWDKAVAEVRQAFG
ncbi:MAG: C4-dicarboxylic acid transporter DauA [Vicinamibacteria bacterium]|nr:C4-dicarboxylic acid transporter DauA [Vicinamibacteria bacterium]